MPKNYQISQYDLPVCVGGHAFDVEVADGWARRVGITRVHMEDTGKTVHGSASGRMHEAEHALVDYNRAGVQRMNACRSRTSARPTRRRPTSVSSGPCSRPSTCPTSGWRRESLRCDANVSIRPEGDVLGVKVEIENMNSVRSLERALAFEVDRQIASLEAGDALVQGQRHWDEDSGTTKTMRSKEEAFDFTGTSRSRTSRRSPRMTRGSRRCARHSLSSRAPGAPATSTPWG